MLDSVRSCRRHPRTSSARADLRPTELAPLGQSLLDVRRRTVVMRALCVAALCTFLSGNVVAQTRPPERLHPELVDKNWGPRMQAAWQRAFAMDWSGAAAQ